MSLRVSGKNMDIGDALRTRATEQFDALVLKYFDGRYEGHLTLAHDGAGYRADCMVHLDSGVVLQTGSHGAEPIAAYEAVVEVINKRLRRYHRKLKSHQRKGTEGTTALSYVLAAPTEEEELHEDYAPPVIAETTSSLRSLSVGEAVMELDLAQRDVVVFRHAGHGGLNVVYRRADGNIGWIDPALGAGTERTGPSNP